VGETEGVALGELVGVVIALLLLPFLLLLFFAAFLDVLLLPFLLLSFIAAFFVFFIPRVRTFKKLPGLEI
jgi:hypothetical protein